jgi:aspartyl-tRNA(Asn)/glutamyl-tRNA(Gln) amidotransferase subunit A
LDLKSLKIGVPKEYFVKGMDPQVEQMVKEAIKKYEGLGAKIIEVDLPYTEYAVASYYLITPSEISANVARYDGIKYGYSDRSGQNLLETYLSSREKGFGLEVKRRIMLGTYALSSGYYDAYYLRAQKVRTLIKQDFDRVLAKVDVLMTPVAPTTAFKLGEKVADPLSMYLCDVFTGPLSLAGLPAISVPCGKIKELPVGLQIIGQRFEEDRILQVAEVLEK